jgi:hypothetical protein
MTFSNPNERNADTQTHGPFDSYGQYAPKSPDPSDLYNQYNPNDPMRPHPPLARWSPPLRFIVGSVIFVVGAELSTYLLEYANIRFQLHLSQPLMGSQMDWLSGFWVLNIGMLLALWFILRRLGFFPSMARGTRRGDSRWREW